jgi:hypothetical protein
VEVSGQLHASAALSPGTHWIGGEKNLALTRTRTLTPVITDFKVFEFKTRCVEVAGMLLIILHPFKGYLMSF